MKIVAVYIEDIHSGKIISEKDFINGNVFTTQNTIIKVLELLGFKKYMCDIIYLDK